MRWIALAVLALSASPAMAAPGRIQGRVVGSADGEPIGFADVTLLPADTTLHRVGGLANADGTFLLEAAPGRYTHRSGRSPTRPNASRASRSSRAG